MKRQPKARTRDVEMVKDSLEKLDVESHVPVAIDSEKQWDDYVKTLGALGEADELEGKHEKFTFCDTGGIVDGLDIDTATTRSAHSTSSSRLLSDAVVKEPRT